jgi:hypothetical protein
MTPNYETKGRLKWPPEWLQNLGVGAVAAGALLTTQTPVDGSVIQELLSTAKSRVAMVSSRESGKDFPGPLILTPANGRDQYLADHTSHSSHSSHVSHASHYSGRGGEPSYQSSSPPSSPSSWSPLTVGAIGAGAALGGYGLYRLGKRKGQDKKGQDK